MPPLDTKVGQNYIDEIIKSLGGVDFVIFDNVMSLIGGNMKEEDAWADTLPWIRSLTKRSIGQLWLHHTGHDKSHAYGTSTREWQLDTVALMESVERPGADIAFTLTFSKSRERTPVNRAEFEPATVTLEGDAWASSGASKAKPRCKAPSPSAQAFYQALTDAIATKGTPRVTRDDWKAVCRSRGLLNEGNAHSARSALSKYRLELIAAKWVGVDGDEVWALEGENETDARQLRNRPASIDAQPAHPPRNHSATAAHP
jgi:hypothetical protein